MIINAHSHFSPDVYSSFFYPDFTLESLIRDMDSNNIQYAITCLNPKLLALLCPNDCSTTCPVYGKHASLNNCSSMCTHKNIHWMKIFDSPVLGELEARCDMCKKLIYKGPDPCHNYNIEFLSQCAKYKNRLFPLLYLHLANSSLTNEVRFFEDNYPNQFIGYKFHPQTDMRSLDEIISFPSSLPVLIHTGLRDSDNSQSALNFARRYKGNVILAHACRLEVKVLKEIKNYPNIFIDMSPACTMFDSKSYTLSSEVSDSIVTAKDIYKIAMDYVTIEKILFGSDVPWGNTKKELELAYSLNLTNDEMGKMMFFNAIAAFNLTFN